MTRFGDDGFLVFPPGSVDDVPFSTLVGKTVKKIEACRRFVRFWISDTERYLLWHDQDCCEIVELEDICGGIWDLIGGPILLAEEVVNPPHAPEVDLDSLDARTCTWTFYKLATIKGSATFRWLGASSGYYSEAVSFGREVAIG